MVVHSRPKNSIRQVPKTVLIKGVLIKRVGVKFLVSDAFTESNAETIVEGDRALTFPVRAKCAIIGAAPDLRKTNDGKLVAAEIMGATSQLLEPFRPSPYAEGKLHPVSASPFPWSQAFFSRE